MTPLQKTTKERKERRSDESQFVIMVLIPCQVSFNMKERAHFVYTKRKNRARKRREEERRKKEEEEGENQERVDVRKIMLSINQSRNYKEKLVYILSIKISFKLKQKMENNYKQFKLTAIQANFN
jgi:hypothetical protein